MRGRSLVIGPLLCVVLAACSSSSKSAAPTTTSGGALTSTTSAAPARESVFVLAVDPTHHTITVDPMQFLTGPAAAAAYHAANPKTTGPPDNDYYIVNPKKDAVIMSLAADAGARVVQAGGTVHTTPVPVPLSTLQHYPALSQHPFWITFEHGAVGEVDEQFVP